MMRTSHARAVLASLVALLVAATASGSGAERPEAQAHIDPRAVREVDRLAAAWEAVQTLTYRLEKRERMRDGEMTYEECLVKLRRPGQVYIRRLAPREGQEVLYDAHKNPRELTAHPGRFPDLTLNLDIEGGLATKDQHHPVTSSGFGDVVSMLRSAIAEAQSRPAGEQLRFLGVHEMGGQPAIGLELRAGSTPPREETAQPGESLFDFARRVGMDAYAILVANPRIGDLDDDLRGGETYVVPTYYAHRGRIWLDVESHLPIRVTLWDAQGHLYEDYRHFDLQVDPPLSDVDFSVENPAYGF